MGAQVIKDLLNGLVHKVIIVGEERTLKRFNVADIYQTILYVKNNCWAFIIVLRERHLYSEPGNKEANLIEPIHYESVKELEITPGPSNETEANYIQDKVVLSI